MILSMGLMVCDVLASPVDMTVFDRDSSRLESMEILPGGDALNVAIGLKRYGNEVAMVGCVGRDPFGDMLVDYLKREGVRVEGVRRHAHSVTSTSIVLISVGGERYFAYYGECNDSLTGDDLPDELIAQASHLHFASVMALPGVTPRGLARLMWRAKSAGLTTSMDMTYREADGWLGEIEEALPFVDIFLPSHNEVKKICGYDDPERAAGFFRSYGLKVLCIKRGADGCYVTDFHASFSLPSLLEERPVDTTGAGDAFCAGFLTSYLAGENLLTSALFASAASAFCIGQPGATSGLRSREETWAYADRRRKELGL